MSPSAISVIQVAIATKNEVRRETLEEVEALVEELIAEYDGALMTTEVVEILLAKIKALPRKAKHG